MAQSLLIPRSDVVRAANRNAGIPWGVVFWVGVGLAIIGLVDIAFLWLPFQIAEIGWRVSTIGTTVDALPLVILALTTMLVASAGRSDFRGLAAVTITSGLMFAALIAMIAVFAMSALRLRSSGEPLTPSDIEIARITLFALIYLCLFGLVAAEAASRTIASADGG